MLVNFVIGDSHITTTEDHHFWNVTDNQWQQTKHIDTGDLLLTANGTFVTAGWLDWTTTHHAPAFDLTINDFHTYFVVNSTNAILVHNCGGPLSPSQLPSVDEINAMNRGFGGTTALTGHVDTVLANASYHDDIYGQSASVIRDVAGRHLFDNGNKRTALALVGEMFSRGGALSPGRALISDVVSQAGAGVLRTVDEIAKALRG